VRKLAVGTNIKMYLGYQQTASWMIGIAAALSDIPHVETFVFVPAPSLVDAQRIFSGMPTGYGAQNMHWAASGPYTGELSAEMLVELGCTHVELGHAERRQYFGDTDETVNLKLKRALASQLRAVVCLGEVDRCTPAAARAHLGDQLGRLLDGIPPHQAAGFMLAYEPRWAIGVDATAPADHVQEMHAYIRTVAGCLLGHDAADKLRIIYGGSIGPCDVSTLCSLPDVDGLFIGRSALDVGQFRQMVMDAGNARIARRDQPQQ